MLKWIRSKLTTRQAPAAEQQLAAIAGIGDFLTPLNYKESESYLPAVIACIDYISITLASFPARVCRRDGTERETVTDHPIADLLLDPHPQLNGMSELLLISCVDLLAYGNCVITIDTIGGKPVLTPIPWGYVTCPYREYSAGYRVTYPGSDSVALPSSRVIHVRIGCIDGGFIGRSPLARNSMTIALSKVVEKATSGLWSNGVYPSIALKTTKILNNDQRAAMRESLISQLGGENRGKPMFLDADFGIEQVAANSKDLEHIEQRMLGIVQICMIFGISPVLIGDLRYGTYTNYGEARRASMGTLAIYQRLFGNALTRKLLANDSDLKIELDSSHLLQTRAEKVTEVATLVEKGVIEAEEGKKELGYG